MSRVIEDIETAATLLREGKELSPSVALALAEFLDHAARISRRAIIVEKEADYTPGRPLMKIIDAVNGGNNE